MQTESSSDSRPIWIGSIGVELYRAAPNMRLAAHGHDSVHYCLPVEGSFYESHGRHEILLEPGWMRVSPPGDRHRIRFGPDTACCLLVHTHEETSGGGAKQNERSFLPVEGGRKLARSILKAMAEPDPIAGLVLEEALLMLQARSVRPKRAAVRPPAWLESARERLEENLSEPPTLDRLAEAVDRTRSQVARAFRGYYGSSVGGFLRSRRLALALRRLATTDHPLSRIAAECGYCDQSHLTREVRRHTKCSPSALRKSLRA